MSVKWQTWRVVVLLFLCAQLVLVGCQRRDQELPFETIHEDGGALGLYGSSAPAIRAVAGTGQTETISEWIAPEVAQMLREVDFDDTFVVAVFQGLQDGGGYVVNVERVTRAATM
jgi:hypothetical protein